MLRLRRTLAFGARVHNYILLLYFFSFILFAMQLWWETTRQFSSAVMFISTLLAIVGIAYAVILILIAIFLWLVDKVFPFWDFFSSLVRGAMFLTGWTIISLFSSLSHEGVVIHF
ncbi:hypothetical protein [Pleomorphochaeta sp. DL1XJH-081]|uniref:hypothetical protein n=1 Tax=Pleomorphochaeta sp. DL1XJH-081 TaxID=3409690 RepID=UPI003BB57DDE